MATSTKPETFSEWMRNPDYVPPNGVASASGMPPVGVPPAAPSRRSRFVTPTDTVQVDLSDGDTATFRASLSWGQELRLLTASRRPLPGQPPDAEPQFDAVAYHVERLLAWLVSWSFVDAAGQAVPITRETVEALEPATAAELTQALEGHLRGKGAATSGTG